MESLVKNLAKRRRKKKQREKRLLKEIYKSVQNFGIKKPDTRTNESGHIRKVSELYLSSFFQGFCKKENQEEGTYNKVNLLEQTIDLCDGDDSVDSCTENNSLPPPCENTKNSEPVIDLCPNLPARNEIIDLTSSPRIECNQQSGPEPTVIDISEDDYKDDRNIKNENDEILVIGTFSKTPNFTKKDEFPPYIPLSDKLNNFNGLISYKEKLKKKRKKRLGLNKIDSKNINQCKRELKKITSMSSRAAKEVQMEENIYVNSPVTLPSSGLRPIIIDGSNVAFVHSNCNFSCKRLEICINYFKEKGHKVTAFVPQFRINTYRSDNPQLLRKLERQGDVVLTPSKKVDGRNIVPYDDRFIVQTAALKGGIIVSRDNYNDLLKENPAWAETIKYRTLAFTWVDDVLMFPKDPLGEHGPTLEDFLRFH